MAETNGEDINAKYKRLLALARNSLEANQVTISQKDKQITQLTTELDNIREAYSTLRLKSRAREQDDLNSNHVPRNILKRVDVGQGSNTIIWILVEYDGDHSDSWVSFRSEMELDDYIQRVPGAPLTKPHRCLTEEESKKIVRHHDRTILLLFHLHHAFCI